MATVVRNEDSAVVVFTAAELHDIITRAAKEEVGNSAYRATWTPIQDHSPAISVEGAVVVMSLTP